MQQHKCSGKPCSAATTVQCYAGLPPRGGANSTCKGIMLTCEVSTQNATLARLVCTCDTRAPYCPIMDVQAITKPSTAICERYAVRTRHCWYMRMRCLFFLCLSAHPEAPLR